MDPKRTELHQEMKELSVLLRHLRLRDAALLEMILKRDARINLLVSELFEQKDHTERVLNQHKAALADETQLRVETARQLERNGELLAHSERETEFFREHCWKLEEERNEAAFEEYKRELDLADAQDPLRSLRDSQTCPDCGGEQLVFESSDELVCPFCASGYRFSFSTPK